VPTAKAVALYINLEAISRLKSPILGGPAFSSGLKSPAQREVPWKPPRA